MRVEAGLAQRDQHVAPRHLLDARDVGDLDRRERLDVHVREVRLERAEHLLVVREPRLHVESADDVELLRQPVGRARRLGEHLVDRVAVGALLLRETGVAAERARRPQRRRRSWG